MGTLMEPWRIGQLTPEFGENEPERLLAVLPKYNHTFCGQRLGLTDNHSIERGEPFGQVEFVERSSDFGGVGVRRMVDE